MIVDLKHDSRYGYTEWFALSPYRLYHAKSFTKWIEPDRIAFSYGPGNSIARPKDVK